MFALNFELLPRDTVCHRERWRGRGNSTASFPLFVASLKMLATAEAACHPLRHCATQRKWTLCHGSAPAEAEAEAEAEAAAVAGESCKLTRAKWKMKMEKESKGKERNGKAFRNAATRKSKPLRTAAKQSQTKPKSKRIETDRKQQQGKWWRGVQRGEGGRAWQSEAGNLCREIEILNLPLHLSRISIWPRVPETDMIQATEWGWEGERRRGRGRGRGWSRSGWEAQWEWEGGEHGAWDSTQGPAKHLIWLGTVGSVSKLWGKKKTKYLLLKLNKNK